MEKIFRTTQCLSEKGKTCISMGLVLPSKVVHIVIKRPRDFTFKPGDYIYINIPDIAKFQWHPFTISSAPEQSEQLDTGLTNYMNILKLSKHRSITNQMM